MPFTTESFECAYVRIKDSYNIWIISPQREKKLENMPERIENRQDEIRWVLRRELKFMSGSRLYHDNDFCQGLTEDIKEKFLYHVNKSKEFDGRQEFFSHKEIIVMCHFTKAKIHWWNIKPTCKHSNFYDKINEA
jgi:hypothetical protein